MINSISLMDFEGSIREKFTRASEYCRNHNNTILNIPAGIYTLEDVRAKEVMNDIFNGTYGRNPEPVMFKPDFPFSIGLDLQNCCDIVVKAYGAILMIDGFMEPISIRNSNNIVIEGLTIDHVRKPFSEGTITQVSDSYIDIAFEKEFLMTTDASVIRVIGYSKENKTFEEISINLDLAEQISEQFIRCYGIYDSKILGNKLYFSHTAHSRPGILISHSNNVQLNDVTIHSQPGMGIVGFKSKDIDINRLRVIPSEGYHMSTNTDATHFACCSGKLSVVNSHFVGHGDDALNIHNYYYSIDKATGTSCNLIVKAPTGTHSQEIDCPDVGYKLMLVDANTLAPIEMYTVLESSGQATGNVVLDKTLPINTEKYLFANMSDLPQLIFKGNQVRNHLARAVLIKTHNALVENCLFQDDTGTAIHIASEGYWHEGITSKNVVIRNNTFIRSGLTWPASAIAINIEAPDNTTTGLHENIIIEGNTVINNKSQVAFSISNSKNVIIRNNKFEGFEKNIEIKHSENIKCEDD